MRREGNGPQTPGSCGPLAQHRLPYASLRPQVMLRNRQISLQELRNQEDFLTKLNQDLIKTIQDMEDSSALKMRSMLQQQNVFGVRPHRWLCSPASALSAWDWPTAPLS